MSLSSYSGLITAIGRALKRTDVAADAADWIVMAEAAACRDIRHRRMICRATAVISTEYSRLPVDYISIQSLVLVTGDTSEPTRHLKYVEPENLASLVDTSSETDTPEFYTVVGTELRVWPVPDTSYTAYLTVYERIPALSDSRTTNWLLTYFPDVYLYGALLHSPGYLQEDDRLQTWEGLYQSAVAKANLSDPTETDKSTRRTDIPRRRGVFNIVTG